MEVFGRIEMTPADKAEAAYEVLRPRPLSENEQLAADGLQRYISECVAAERERCAKIAEQFDETDFVYKSVKVDGYSKGSYAMIDGEATMKVVADAIRKGE